MDREATTGRPGRPNPFRDSWVGQDNGYSDSMAAWQLAQQILATVEGPGKKHAEAHLAKASEIINSPASRDQPAQYAKAEDTSDEVIHACLAHLYYKKLMQQRQQLPLERRAIIDSQANEYLVRRRRKELREYFVKMQDFNKTINTIIASKGFGNPQLLAKATRYGKALSTLPREEPPPIKEDMPETEALTQHDLITARIWFESLFDTLVEAPREEDLETHLRNLDGPKEREMAEPRSLLNEMYNELYYPKGVGRYYREINGNQFVRLDVTNLRTDVNRLQTLLQKMLVPVGSNTAAFDNIRKHLIDHLLSAIADMTEAAVKEDARIAADLQEAEFAALRAELNEARQAVENCVERLNNTPEEDHQARATAAKALAAALKKFDAIVDMCKGTPVTAEALDQTKGIAKLLPETIASLNAETSEGTPGAKSAEAEAAKVNDAIQDPVGTAEVPEQDQLEPLEEYPLENLINQAELGELEPDEYLTPGEYLDVVDVLREEDMTSPTVQTAPIVGISSTAMPTLESPIRRDSDADVVDPPPRSMIHSLIPVTERATAVISGDPSGEKFIDALKHVCNPKGLAPKYRVKNDNHIWMQKDKTDKNFSQSVCKIIEPEVSNKSAPQASETLITLEINIGRRSKQPYYNAMLPVFLAALRKSQRENVPLSSLSLEVSDLKKPEHARQLFMAYYDAFFKQDDVRYAVDNKARSNIIVNKDALFEHCIHLELSDQGQRVFTEFLQDKTFIAAMTKGKEPKSRKPKSDELSQLVALQHAFQRQLNSKPAHVARPTL